MVVCEFFRRRTLSKHIVFIISFLIWCSIYEKENCIVFFHPPLGAHFLGFIICLESARRASQYSISSATYTIKITQTLVYLSRKRMTQFTQPYLCGYKRSKAQCTYGGSQWRVLLNQSIVLRQVGAARTGSTARTETAFHECTRVWSTSFVALTIAKTTSVHITLCTDAEQSGNSTVQSWHKELNLRKHVYLLMSLPKIFLRSRYCQRWVDTDSKEKCEPCQM